MQLFAHRFVSELVADDEMIPGTYDEARALWVDATGTSLVDAVHALPTRASRDKDRTGEITKARTDDDEMLQLSVRPKTAGDKDHDQSPVRRFDR